MSCLAPCLGPGTAAAFARVPDSARLDRMQHIDSVVVVGTFRPEKVIPAQVLSGERLQRLNAHSVADAIRYFSGVQIKDYGGIGGLKTINVRGMGTQHVGVFYDGIQLGNAQNGQIDLGKYSLDNMAAVTLYNGQKSSGVQSARDYASASAVYLRTRIPEFREGRRCNLKLTLKGGSFGTVNPSVLYEQRLGERISNSLNAEFLYTTGRYRFSYVKADGYDTTAVRQNGDVRALRIEEGLFGQIPDGNWRVKAYFYNSERGYPGAFVREEPGRFRHEDRQWDSNFFLQGSFFKAFGDRYRLSVHGKYACDYLHYLSDPRLDVTTMYVDNHYLQQEAYLSAAHEFALFKWWDVNLATDLQYNTLDADLVNFVYPSRLTSLTALATTFRFGRVTVQGSLLHTFVEDFARERGAEAGVKNVFTPTLVVQYRPFRSVDLALRAFCKRIFRMPTLNDLYYTFIGNKYLKPEYTTQYNLGAAYTKEWPGARFRRFEASLDAYCNEVDDKIIAMPTSNQFQWTMVNLGHVGIRGADAVVSGSMRFGRLGVDCRATYTWQRARDLTDRTSAYYGGQIPYIPWHSGSAVVGLSFGGWMLDYSFIYTGERYESSANIPENHALAWYTSDLSLSKRFHLRRSQLRASVEVMDLRTARHITQISIPNCRYIVFKGRYAYVSSYAGPVQIDPNARLGYVAKIDTATMQIVGTCTVGYQPEEMVIVGKKLYVANSGGYRVPDYDRTVSVIDLDTFGEVKKIDVAINLHRMELDAYGQIWVSSRGDYYDTPSRTYVIDSRTDEVTDEFKLLPNSEMTVCGDSLYVYSTEWSYPTQSNTVSYAIVNVRTKKIVTRNFITDGTDRRIAIPYGIAVNPATREIFVTDAGNYVTPGKLYCFNPDGTKKWEVETGDIPAHIAFTYTELAPLR